MIKKNTNEILSPIERMAHKYGKSEEYIKEKIKEQFADKYSKEEFSEVMDKFNTPINDTELFNHEAKFAELNQFDDEFNYSYNQFNDQFDELDEFDLEYDFLINEFNKDYDEIFSVLNYNTIFVEVNINLIKLFAMILSRFKYNYIKDEIKDYLDDFDFNNDLSMLYNEKYNETSNIFIRSTKRFDKVLKRYNENKNKFLDTKASFDKNIQIMGYIDLNQDKSIAMLEIYLSDIKYIKEFAKRIITIDNNHDSYNDFKTVLELVVNELPNIEKYCKEHINKIKNNETHPDYIQEYLDNISLSYDEFLKDHKNEKRSRKDNNPIKSMINFTDKLISAENSYKINADKIKLIEEEMTNEIRIQSQTERIDFNQIKKAKEDSINVFKDFIKNFNSLIYSLNKRIKLGENEEVSKKLIKNLEKSINILNTFIKITKE
jgi:hypothetical protein